MPSINDLLKGTGDAGASASQTGKPLPTVSQENIAEQFTKKMRELELSAKEREVEQRARALGVGYINLKAFPIGPETILTIPRAQSEELKAICFLNTGSEIRVAAIDPSDPRIQEIIHQIAERLQANVRPYIISEESYRHAVKLYDAVPEVKPIDTKVTIEEDTLNRYKAELTNLKLLEEKIRRVSLTDIVTLVLAGAIVARSSDIHIEAEEDDIALRYRVDGILRKVASIPKDLWPRMISRVKLLAGLKLNVDQIPQDGRISIELTEDKIDVRVSTLPTAWGESVVMRLLMSSAVDLSFDQLGLRGRAYEGLKREVERPNGMIITTGPTGSGKTTTLYAILSKLNDEETKIITLEDPVEYKIKGLNQSQMDPSQDYTFAKGLRSILRQDPDVVMVGEIRDLETAEVAIQAALTGHLMLSTIHTNSAAGAIPRFLSMGVKPFLLAPALNAIIGQRLVRRIHEECREPLAIDDAQRTRVEEILAGLPEEERAKLLIKELAFFHGKGCDGCGDSGYKGRLGIYEIMLMSKEIETIILSGSVSEYQMQEVATRSGMVTMVQDGVLKALDGLTTLEEVFRVAE